MFSYATHAAAVALDPATGAVEILDYAVVEDCGTVVNPMVVDGQIAGGTAQGIGTALYEEVVFDGDGQPLATSFADYLLPGATEIPALAIGHMATPAESTSGMKGMGEGGAIAPPAAIANGSPTRSPPPAPSSTRPRSRPGEVLAGSRRRRGTSSRRPTPPSSIPTRTTRSKGSGTRARAAKFRFEPCDTCATRASFGARSGGRHRRASSALAPARPRCFDSL